MAEEKDSPEKIVESITDKHMKKYMIIMTHIIISGSMCLYTHKMYSATSSDFLAKFDGIVFLWYSVATLALIVPTVAIDIINAIKGK